MAVRGGNGPLAAPKEGNGSSGLIFRFGMMGMESPNAVELISGTSFTFKIIVIQCLAEVKYPIEILPNNSLYSSPACIANEG